MLDLLSKYFFIKVEENELSKFNHDTIQLIDLLSVISKENNQGTSLHAMKEKYFNKGHERSAYIKCNSTYTPEINELIYQMKRCGVKPV